MNAIRSILHLDLDSFFVSVERLLDPSLVGKPIIVGGDGQRGIVTSCSYEARAFGVHAAMPAIQAKRLCPQAIFIRGHMTEYARYSSLVTQIIRERAPLFEKSSIDEFYIDLSGMDHFFGCLKWSRELKQRISRQSGLPISFGLSSNKLVSKVATDFAKPDGEKFIPHGEEKTFLGPLPIGKIPMVGKKTEEILHSVNIRFVQDMWQYRAEQLEELLGSSGLSLWHKCQGIDNTPVRSHHESKSISIERTFDQDLCDLSYLESLLQYMTEQLAYKLRKNNQLSSCVSIKLRFDDFETISRQIHIPHTQSDELLIKSVKHLFDEMYDGKRKLRLAGLRLSNFIQGNEQINLFDDTAEKAALYHAMDALKNKFGKQVVLRARGLGLNRGNRPDVNPFSKE